MIFKMPSVKYFIHENPRSQVDRIWVRDHDDISHIQYHGDELSKMYEVRLEYLEA
jgi:hypothetical protein